MSDLTEFLLARIAEVEAECDLFAYRSDPTGRLSGLLRLDCEAMRRIVQRCKWIEQHPEWGNDMELSGEWEAAENTLMDLATIYADHPDCREEWRP